MTIVENFQKVDNEYFSGHVEVFTNPSRSTFMKQMREHGSARGFLDVGKDEVHVWFGPVLHHDIEADGECWLTWNEPRMGDLKVQYDEESLYDALGLDEDDKFDVNDFLNKCRRFKSLAASYHVLVSSR